MIKLLRRRLRESQPDLAKATMPPAPLQRAHDMLREIWAQTGGAGSKHPVWRLAEGVLRMALDRMRTGEPDHAGKTPDRAP
jgi:uncharacterized protein (DUF2267 family)